MIEHLLQYPLLSALVAFGVLAGSIGAILAVAAMKFKVESNPLLVDQIDALLPQTQCGECGHPGCRPYARAIAEGDAINKCPPGGQPTVQALADLLGVKAVTLDLVEGVKAELKRVAYIREDECIGCTKCLAACPTDAILGAAKSMHTVIVDECTGCDLCVEPCPVDCIDMLLIQQTPSSWRWELPPPSHRQMVNANKGAANDANLIATDRGRGSSGDSTGDSVA